MADEAPAAYTPKKAPVVEGKMSDDELRQTMDAVLSNAIQFTDSELSPDRAKANDYFKAAPFGNEEVGRSQAVLPEVRDSVLALMPPVLRRLFGPKRAVRFRAKRADRVEQENQITDFIQHIFEIDGGFLKAHAVLQDGFIRRLGGFKWTWQEEKVETGSMSGVQMADLEALLLSGDIELTRNTPRQAKEGEDVSFDIEWRRVLKAGRPRIHTMPPEEILFGRGTRDQDSALLIAHRMLKTTSELLELGVTQEQIDEHGGAGSALEENEERLSRGDGLLDGDKPEAGEANDEHIYIESYIRVDYDGDDTAELRKVCTLGPGFYPVHNKPVRRVPMSLYCPIPEAHSLSGTSVADLSMSRQLITSSIMRGILDSLAASIFPRTWYREGDANVTDVMTTAIGAPIRTRSGANAVGAMTVPFAGKEAMPLLGYFDQRGENSTGTNKGSQGVDADSLQSSTRSAVAATINGSQLRTDFYVRIFAEMTLKPLFLGLRDLYLEHKPAKMTAELRGRWVELDPSTWDEDPDVSVEVALGEGAIEDEISTLTAIAAKQESFIQQGGPNNPVSTLGMLRNTLAEIVELMGRDPAKYFNMVDDKALAAQAEEQAKNPPPSPEMVIAQAQIQIEQMKAQVDVELKRADLEMKKQQSIIDAQMKHMEITLKDDRERDKNAADITLRRIELELTHKAEINDQELTAEIERERISSQAEGTTE